MRNLKFWAIGMLALVLGACGGGGGSGGNLTGNPGSQNGNTAADSIQLIASASQVGSDQSNTNSVRISAIVRDADSNVVEGADLVFSAPEGSVEEIDLGVTNASGIGEALIKPFGNLANRTITVTVREPVEDVSATIDIEVVGTSLEITGPTNVALDDTATLTLRLSDGNDAGIAGETISLTSASGNTIPATAVTNTSGEVQVSLIIDGPDTQTDDTITATIASLGLTQTFTLAVSNDVFQFTSPAAGAEVLLVPADETLTIQWQQGGGAVPDGSTIEFTADRGTLSAGSATTVGGVASVDIDSVFAGQSTITATGTTLGAVPLTNGPTTQLTIEFVADNPDNLNLSAFPNTLVSGDQSTITAVVKDAAGNRVKNVIVDFNITADPSAGGLSVSSAVTDSAGVATTVYTGGPNTTENDGVVITATIRDTAIDDTTTLTVAGESINFVIGTGNDLFTISPTRFGVQYTVVATDVTGAPAIGEELRLSIRSWQYRKGQLAVDSVNDQWVYTSALVGGDPIYFCPDEDDSLNPPGNENGSLDPGEDDNGNGTLEAGNVATIVPVECASVEADEPGLSQQTLLTNNAGAVEVCVVYPQNYGLWLDVRLTATVPIDGGTEDSEFTQFLLPPSAEDINNTDVSPPGQISPFGTLDCSDGTGL